MSLAGNLSLPDEMSTDEFGKLLGLCERASPDFKRLSLRHG